MSVKKYFLAIVIPSPLYEQIEQIKQQLFLGCGLKGALRSPSHITLHRPFEWKEEKEKQLVNTLHQFKFSNNFEVELSNFSFFEPRVIFVAVVENILLNHLHKNLKLFAKKELKLFNEVYDLRAFHPHITIASRDLKKQTFYSLQEEFKHKKIRGRFNCSSFYLLKLEKKWEIINEIPF